MRPNVHWGRSRPRLGAECLLLVGRAGLEGEWEGVVVGRCDVGWEVAMVILCSRVALVRRLAVLVASPGAASGLELFG